MIQNILPKIQANLAGAADSIMLDLEGFVAETNATNLFLVCRERGLEGTCKTPGCEGAVLVTPTGDHCLPGITRGTVLLLAKELGIETEVRRVSLSEFYCADEVFTTGTVSRELSLLFLVHLDVHKLTLIASLTDNQAGGHT